MIIPTFNNKWYTFITDTESYSNYCNSEIYHQILSS